LKLGVIGYGHRISAVIRHIQKQDPNCKVTAIVDIRKDEILEENKELADNVRFFDTPEDMIGDGRPDGILIGTRCSLHTEMALKVIPSGIPLFLEKPVSTTFEDWQRLKRLEETYQPEVVVSFPLRFTQIIDLVRDIVDSGKIGTVEHVQALTNVTYGGVYFHNWYRDEKESGGLFLQKATHDFDYINHLVRHVPTDICAMSSKQIFKGTKPAGLKCIDCDENATCEESTAFKTDRTGRWPYCCFAEDTGNEDSGSALIRYDTGMHVSYSQNFVVRRKAGSRGARLIGYKGTIEFDFLTGIVKVFLHHAPRVETYEFETGSGHFGGDAVLSQNFIEVMRGDAASASPLKEGLLSALMCLKARESAQTGTFQTIDWKP